MTEVFVCSAAEIDYTESLVWYAERSAQAANDFDSEISKALTSIAGNPERYPKCDERHHYFQMRRYPFQIVYRIINENVVVIAFAHASRSTDYWRNR